MDCNPLLLLFISMVKLSKIWPVDSCVLLAVPVILSLSFFGGVVLGLYCSTWASLVAAHRLSCPAACRILVPCPGIEPASPALEGRFFTTAPPGKSLPVTLLGNFFFTFAPKRCSCRLFFCFCHSSLEIIQISKEPALVSSGEC